MRLPPLDRAGVLGLGAGLLASGAVAGFVAEQVAVFRLRHRDDPEADERFGGLRGDVVPVVADDGTRLHVEVDEPADHGGAPGAERLTVVFCHGFALHQDLWHYQRRDLRGRARLVLWDHRGHGRSGRGSTPVRDFDQLGRDLQAVVEATAPTGDLVLVGHSMGGMTVMAFAAAHPELFGDRVRGVAFVGTSAGDLAKVSLGLPQVPLVRRALDPALQLLARQAELVELTRRAARGVNLLGTRQWSFASDVPPSVVDFASRMIESTPIDVIAEFYPSFARHDRYAALDVLNNGVDVVVVVGEHDLLTPADHSRLIVQAVPGARFVSVPDAGHLIMLEHPAVVTAAIGDLVDRVLAGASPGAAPGESDPLPDLADADVVPDEDLP